MNNKKGFTLIELLVVIAIIGILSSIVISSLSSARRSSRDARRLADIKQISSALELYYQNFTEYPTCLVPGTGCSTTLQGSGFISPVPTNPSGGNYSYAGLDPDGLDVCSSYHLGVSLENRTHKSLSTDDDGTPDTICSGSNSDFSGVSNMLGVFACNATSTGPAQPTAAANGESCYDLISNRQ